MTLQDGGPERISWRALRQSATIVGPLRARAVAALALRVLSQSDHGYTKSIYRVARHTSSPSPAIVHLPEQWSSASPLVRVRRLGLSLDLDLRDNLQRVLSMW